MRHMLAHGFWALRLPLLAFYERITATPGHGRDADYRDFLWSARRYFDVGAGPDFLRPSRFCNPENWDEGEEE